jgi:hypothetical protein
MLDVLYIMAKVKPTEYKYFKCIIDSIIILLPNTRFIHLLNTFQNDYPIDSHTMLFKWVFKLDQYICFIERCSTPPKFDMIEERYSKNKIDKTRWARPYWKLIHMVSDHIPRNPNENIRIVYTAFVVSIRQMIPCEKCRFHMQQYIASHPIFKSWNDIGGYMVDFHNDVNKRLGKPKFVRR